MARDFVDVGEHDFDEFFVESGGLWGLGADVDPQTQALLQKRLAEIDAMFARASGAKGNDLRRVLEARQPLLDAAITLYRAKPLSSDAKAWRDVAYAIQFDLKRSELHSDAPVPDWLMVQVRDRWKSLLITGMAATQPGILDAAWEYAADVVESVVGATKQVYCATPAGLVTWQCWSPTKKAVVVTGIVVGGLLLTYGVYKILLAAAPVAVQYAKGRAGIHGLGVIHRRPSGKTVVCFRGRRHGGRKREICFPARDHKG